VGWGAWLAVREARIFTGCSRVREGKWPPENLGDGRGFLPGVGWGEGGHAGLGHGGGFLPGVWWKE